MDSMRFSIAALAAALAVVVPVLGPRIAHADPVGAELDPLFSVDANTFDTYRTYGAGGWQFVTPDGVRCRLMTYSRWQGPPSATCWGSLPGVVNGTNYAYVQAFTEPTDPTPKSGLGTADLNDFETYRSVEHRSGSEVDRVDPASYPLLGPGQKLVVKAEGSVVSCGVVDAPTVICRIDGTFSPMRTGFVLSPRGSRSF
jgi:hypothetical protein